MNTDDNLMVFDEERHPNVVKAMRYIDDVLAGRIDACKYVKQACQRQKDDLARAEAGWLYYFDADAAERVCKFTGFLSHFKGPLAGSRIVIEPWQAFILTTVFGWLRHDNGKRRYRNTYIEVPRGSGKTTLSVGPALYCLAGEKESGAEVYVAARLQKQAKIAWDAAAAMLRRAPEFRKAIGVELLAHRIIKPDTDSFFEAVSSDADSLDGRNVYFGLIDELHAHRDSRVYDSIQTGAGKRDVALIWAITTAGSDVQGVCYTHRNLVTRVLSGTLTDDAYFGIIYTLDEGDDWTDPASWKKANPNYGVSVDPEHLAMMAKRAMADPVERANFLTKHLNVWSQSESALFDLEKWRSLSDPTLKIEDFAGEPCFVGMDLASKEDIAAWAAVFERDGKLVPFVRCYIPESKLTDTEASYAVWAEDERGVLTATDGNIIDFAQIEEDIVALRDEVGIVIREIAVDPSQSTYLATRLGELGFEVKTWPQHTANMSEPTKELSALIASGDLVHPYTDRDPLTWMIGNVVGHYNAKDLVHPKKERRENKIDGAIALIMAIGLKLRAEPDGANLDDFVNNMITVTW